MRRKPLPLKYKHDHDKAAGPYVQAREVFKETGSQKDRIKWQKPMLDVLDSYSRAISVMQLIKIILFIFLLSPQSAISKVIGAVDLYPLVTEGVPLLEKGKLDLLHIKNRMMSEEQRQEIKKLKAIGYISGSFVHKKLGRLRIKSNLQVLNAVELEARKLSQNDCSMKLVISDERYETLYKTTVRPSETEDILRSKEGSKGGQGA